MKASLSAAVLALIVVLPVRVLSQPPIGGATIRPDGPGRYVVENSLGQQVSLPYVTGSRPIRCHPLA